MPISLEHNTQVGLRVRILAAKRRDAGADTTALEQDHRKQHGAGIDRLVYAPYLPAARQAGGLITAGIKLVEESAKR
jgi:hypothetical protein